MNLYHTLPTIKQLAYMQQGIAHVHSSVLLANRATASATYNRLALASDVLTQGYIPSVAWDTLSLQDFYVPKTHVGNGVIMCDIRDFVHEYPGLAEKYITAHHKAETSALHALVAACYNRGAVLYIPPHVRLEGALDVVKLLGGYRQELLLEKLIVIVGSHACVTIHDMLHSGHMAANTFLRSVEYHCDDYATVKVVHTQNLAQSVYDFSRVRLVCGKQSSCEYIMTLLGGGTARIELDVLLAGEYAHTTVRGMYALHGQQRLDISTRQEHTAPRTTSSIALKGGLHGSSYALFDGIIAINQTATQTKASQNNHTILLSTCARSKSMPRLEVLTNDVHCTHGSAVGQLDAQQVLYLQSRGLTLSQAKRMILRGFFAQAVGDDMCEAGIKKLCNE